MKQFIETLCIRDGQPQHTEWHQRRVDATLMHFYPDHRHSWELNKCIDVPSDFQAGLTRCRIEYDAHHISIHYFHFTPEKIQTLKLIEAPPDFDYGYKYADREILNDLYEQRNNADDILITRNGWVTDTSIANIAFLKNGRWYSPSLPLLAGTTWKRLVSERILIPRPINQTEIVNFESFRVFNALNDFETAAASPVMNIR